MTALSNNLNKNLSEISEKGVIVADTSSLLIAGPQLLDNLKNCKFVLPAIVIKELEDKRNHPTLGFLAREWLRLVEKYRVSDGCGLNSGVIVDEDRNVKLKIEPNHSSQKSLPSHLQDGSHDSTILAVAYNLRNDLENHNSEEENVILLSNDMPMRLHATLDLDIDAVEYSSMDSRDEPLKSHFVLNIHSKQVKELGIYNSYLTSHLEELVKDNVPDDCAKVFFAEIFIDGSPSPFSVVSVNGVMRKVDKKNKAYRVTSKTIEQSVFLDLMKRNHKDLPVVSVSGAAGTGKTILTIACALEELDRKNYEKIIVFRSLHELGQGQEMGFLPGNVDEKMAPWAGAINDSIEKIVHLKSHKRNSSVSDVERQKDEFRRLQDLIEIAPITYLRGRSLSNTFMILEEAQNFSRSEILNILSRVGDGTKIVLTFDSSQVDNRFLNTGKNADVWSVIDSLQDTGILGHVNLTKNERSRVAEVASRILAEGQV